MSPVAARRYDDERGHLAQVIPLRRHRSAPRRWPRNGHHPDCPYPHEPAPTCPICQSIAKGATEPEDR